MSRSDEWRLADRRVTEWFRRQQASTEREHEPDAPDRAPVITISRQYGAGGITVAGDLARRLGPPWEVWEKELIEAVASSAQVRTEMVESLDQRSLSWMDEMLRRTFGRDVLDPAAYKKHLAQTLLALSQQGFKIIVGRGANFVLHHALNIRLLASEEYRVHTTVEREKVTEQEALEKLRAMDHVRADYTRKVFGRAISDPTAYDIVFRVDTLGLGVTEETILAAARARYRLPSTAGK